MSQTPHPVAPRMGMINADENGHLWGSRDTNCSGRLWSHRHRARLKSLSLCMNLPLNSALPMSATLPLPPEPERFEDALSELERLVQAMETSNLPLDSLLDNYRRGAQLLEFCRARLQAVEAQVKLLEDGQLKDWAAP